MRDVQGEGVFFKLHRNGNRGALGVDRVGSGDPRDHDAFPIDLSASGAVRTELGAGWEADLEAKLLGGLFGSQLRKELDAGRNRRGQNVRVGVRLVIEKVLLAEPLDADVATVFDGRRDGQVRSADLDAFCEIDGQHEVGERVDGEEAVPLVNKAQIHLGHFAVLVRNLDRGDAVEKRPAAVDADDGVAAAKGSLHTRIGDGSSGVLVYCRQLIGELLGEQPRRLTRRGVGVGELGFVTLERGGRGLELGPQSFLCLRGFCDRFGGVGRGRKFLQLRRRRQVPLIEGRLFSGRRRLCQNRASGSRDEKERKRGNPASTGAPKGPSYRPHPALLPDVRCYGRFAQKVVWVLQWSLIKTTFAELRHPNYLEDMFSSAALFSSRERQTVWMQNGGVENVCMLCPSRTSSPCCTSPSTARPHANIGSISVLGTVRDRPSLIGRRVRGFLKPV